jgi:hypothetical protein
MSPPRKVAVMTKVAASLALVGAPEMTPVRPLSHRPEGSSGPTTYRSIGPDTAGVNEMASPTTAGKGCDPLYDNAGGDGVGGAPPPQAESQDRPMIATPMRIGITTQFAWQPASTAPPPPQATMRKARPITDPIKRNMKIPSYRFADGICCHSKRLGLHEFCVKVGSCFREDSGKTSGMAEGAANHRVGHSSSARAEHQFQSCSAKAKCRIPR